MSPVIIISACLLGNRCRWDGGTVSTAIDLDPNVCYLPVCPEQMGGMPTPRPPCQLTGGSGEDVLAGRERVVEVESGRDQTEQFLRGADETLRLARLFGATRAIMKQRSPSCGCGQIYRGEEILPGNGVAVARLLEAGIKVEPL